MDFCRIFNKLSQPLSLLILFSAIFVVLVLTVIIKTQSQYQSLKFQPFEQYAQFQFVQLNTATALCLDGSPGGYYISKNGDPNKILLFFEGGGWCHGNDVKQTLEDCYKRSKTVKGSTISHPQSSFMKFNQGILSKDPRNNFKDWKKVLLLYCDGSGHQGTKQEPVQVKDKKLYFRGYNITVERFDDLQKRIGLFSKASQVVVSGCSAGGLAAFHWANYVTQRVIKAKVHVLADSGIFYDSYHVQTQSLLLRQQYKTLMQIVNRQIDIPVPECLKVNRLSHLKCMFAQNVIGEIKAPLFVIQGLYDQWSIINILGINCLHQYSQKKCSPIERYVMQQNRRNVVNVLEKVKNDSQNGVWAPSCSLHCFTQSSSYYNDKFRIPYDSQNSVSLAVKKWLQNSTSSHFSIDEEKWPSNAKCSGTNYFV